MTSPWNHHELPWNHHEIPLNHHEIPLNHHEIHIFHGLPSQDISGHGTALKTRHDHPQWPPTGSSERGGASEQPRGSRWRSGGAKPVRVGPTEFGNPMIKMVKCPKPGKLSFNLPEKYRTATFEQWWWNWVWMEHPCIKWRFRWRNPISQMISGDIWYYVYVYVLYVCHCT